MAIPPNGQWPDDRLLIESLQAGRSQGLDGLFHKYYTMLVSFAIRFTRDEDAARDVVQEVYFRLWKNRDRIHISSSAKSYLFRAVRNQALNHLRDQPDWEPLQDHDRTIPVAEPFLTEEDDSQKQRIMEAVGKLPPRARTVFELSRFEGLTYPEIADFMGISEKTVENQMRIALFKLREWLCMILLISTALLGNFNFFVDDYQWVMS